MPPRSRFVAVTLSATRTSRCACNCPVALAKKDSSSRALSLAAAVSSLFDMTSTGGLGGTTFTALSGIGSDLSVSVSFSIANELLSAASDEQLAEEELVSLMLGFAVVASALQAATRRAVSQRAIETKAGARKFALDTLRPEVRAALSAGQSAGAGASSDSLELAHAKAFVAEAEGAAIAKLRDRKTSLDFAELVIDIVQRIFVAVTIQLLAASVRSNEPSRTVRLISLCGLAVFFLLIESLTARTVV